ncbi:TIGR00730 family Rossman fold protein [Leptospira borgpetersenii serovar Ballum]|uniref:Cytokinin riboside 5'-monophosphate phosphoribohydrolase n=8 Tax=Leptospira borgpetersenii TaxID=174 RepID=M3HP82_LEPBO|nr:MULTISPECIES: TIGR00730 family Rossman fold protein [Leptospira]EMF99459.1 TIGR00730 family protein [Leptospira borgpetersenii str. 200701203]EMO08629.1 TIGR00730 family protein [Leptospira borgpetersenii str. Noumea 25]EMO64580.1 TIGR00730 family protein [Leptospira borgpetersenii serovar Pomona str. 200901868]ALO24628.1 TIGR00730 family protein [Leptospira borgpetersenii serovar Ballum]ANG99755.1 Cytokinin riboside 5'-monophosphate phosphoribohydrolase [Leptospira borgpetersenii str. 4E]
MELEREIMNVTKLAVCVFCGSRSGTNPVYTEAAKDLGRLLVEKNLDLVFGGASCGIMGTIADAVMEKGGGVSGIIPDFLSIKEVKHDRVKDLMIVSSMHERKFRMYEKSSGFIALPGGIGTLDELVEITTWNQLKLISKPLGLLNVNGYFDYLLKQLERMVEDGFLDPETKNGLIVSQNPEELLDLLHRRFV